MGLETLLLILAEAAEAVLARWEKMVLAQKGATGATVLRHQFLAGL